MYMGLRLQYLLFSSKFNKTSTFCTDFRKNTHIVSHEKSVRWEPICSMQTDGEADAMDAYSRLLQFCERRLETAQKGFYVHSVISGFQRFYLCDCRFY